MRQDNRGMTLAELIIAIAISVIIIGAAAFFIRSALRGYETASDTINLQMESQVLMEQLGTWVMEGNRVKVADSTNLVIYSIPRKAGQKSTKRVIGVSDGKLYMKVVEDILNPDTDADTAITAADAVIENCIGEYVVEFTPVVDAENPDKVTVLLKLESGTREYTLKNEWKVRNELRLTNP